MVRAWPCQLYANVGDLGHGVRSMRMGAGLSSRWTSPSTYGVGCQGVQGAVRDFSCCTAATAPTSKLKVLQHRSQRTHGVLPDDGMACIAACVWMRSLLCSCWASHSCSTFFGHVTKKCLLQFEGLGYTECKQKNKAGLRTALVVPYLRCSNPPLSHLFSG